MDMYKFFSAVLNLHNNDLIEDLKSISEYKFINKGEIIIENGQIQTDIYFLINGIFRAYFYNDKGKEFTDCFGFECGQPLMACHSLGEKSNAYIEALEDSLVIKMPVSKLLDFIEKYSELLNLYNILVIKSIDLHNELREIKYKLSAKKRYEWFLSKYSKLNGRLKDKDIASFLGIDPVSLSRLKKFIN